MGTWGTGNFDGDAQCDIRDDFVRDTAHKIEDCLRAPDLDGIGADDSVMPWIGILLAVCDRCGGHPPRPHVIARWEKRFLQLFEQDSGAWSDMETANGPPRAIVNTFTELTKLSRNLYGEHADDDMPSPGSTYLFPLDDQTLGSCRILSRAMEDDDLLYGAPMVLVATTEWIGTSVPCLDNPLLRSILRINQPNNPSSLARLAIGWLSTPPPPNFRYLGIITPSDVEARFNPGEFIRDWTVLPEQRLFQWMLDQESRGH